MKKLFEKEVRGFYVMSLVSGILLSMSTIVMVNLGTLQYELRLPALALDADGLSQEYFDDLSAFIDISGWLVPFNRVFNWIIDARATVVFAVLTLVTVALYTIMISSAKHWRTKFLQSIGWMLLFLTVSETILIGINIFDLVDVFGIVILLPAVLLVIPVLILINTRNRALQENLDGFCKTLAKQDLVVLIEQGSYGKDIRDANGFVKTNSEIVDTIKNAQNYWRQLQK